MSETQEPNDFPLFATSQTQKKKKQTALAETSSTEQTHPILNELQSLRAQLGNIECRFDTIENRLDAMSTSVSAVH